MSNEAVKVLVADDGRDNREFIVDYILKPNGFVPLIARDGQEAMELVRQHEPDIILLDLQMPRMNGLEVLDALKAEGRDIPVILMTFHGSEEIAIEVYRKGVRDYVKKPYTVEEMLDAMDRGAGRSPAAPGKGRAHRRLLHANASLNRRIRELNTPVPDRQKRHLADEHGSTSAAHRGCGDSGRWGAAGQSADAGRRSTGLPGVQVQHATSQRSPMQEFSRDKIAWRAVQSGQPVVLSPEELRKAPRSKSDAALGGDVYPA